MPEALRITLPLPPSQNKATRNLSDAERARLRAAGRGVPPRVATKEMKQWRQDAGWMLQSRKDKGAFISGPFRIRVFINQDARMDVDNCQKSLCDLIAKHRLTPDDRFAQSVSSERSADVEPGQCLVIVEAAQ